MRFLCWLTGGLLVVFGVSLAAVYGLSALRLSRHYAVTVEPLPAPDGAGAQARGMHLLALAKCGECHGDDYGGRTMIDHPMLGTLSGPNLTPGGRSRADAELVQAIRYGLRPDGRPLVGMPTAEHVHFSDGELADIIAALRALPPIERETPPLTLGPVFRLLYLLDEIELVGVEKIDLQAGRPAAVPPGETRAYGEHLARTGGCYSCHGDALVGGVMAGAPPDYPPASNITPDPDVGIGRWSEADFVRALREGVRPDGSDIDPAMPWRYTQQMTDAELRALWMHLQAVPARGAADG